MATHPLAVGVGEALIRIVGNCKGCTRRHVGCHNASCPLWAAHEASKDQRYAATQDAQGSIAQMNMAQVRNWQRKGSLGRRVMRCGQR